MQKYFKYLGIIGLCLLSFYYTNEIALYVKNKNPLLQSINEVKESKYVSSINSTLIDNLYIIPGLNGQEVNVNKSFMSMQKAKEYNDELLVYNIIKPTISLEDNKDKIIIRGNEKKNSVSLIFEEESDLTKYLTANGYQINLLITEEKYNLSYELINNSNNSNTYHNIDKYLNKKKVNKNLCYVKNNIPKLCQDKYLFQESLVINHSNLSLNKNKIHSGEIILVQKTLSISELEILLNQIKYYDLNIVYLSELIKE